MQCERALVPNAGIMLRKRTIQWPGSCGVYTFNHSTEEGGVALQIRGQPRLHTLANSKAARATQRNCLGGRGETKKKEKYILCSIKL